MAHRSVVPNAPRGREETQERTRLIIARDLEPGTATLRAFARSERTIVACPRRAAGTCAPAPRLPRRLESRGAYWPVNGKRCSAWVGVRTWERGGRSCAREAARSESSHRWMRGTVPQRAAAARACPSVLPESYHLSVSPRPIPALYRPLVRQTPAKFTRPPDRSAACTLTPASRLSSRFAKPDIIPSTSATRESRTTFIAIYYPPRERLEVVVNSPPSSLPFYTLSGRP
ncbi:hypothetical protein C8Q79DRAFT_102101 [Trametes meyenii]|nr:hypothetical protein C8Q79DRAFT_102101 [Trametes meyenii]